MSRAKTFDEKVLVLEALWYVHRNEPDGARRIYEEARRDFYNDRISDGAFREVRSVCSRYLAA